MRSALRLLPLAIIMTVMFASCRRAPQAAKPTQPTPSPEATVKQSPSATPPPISGKAYPGTGVITDINREEGWVEIDHQEIKGLMAAMTMEFDVKDKSLFDNVAVGDRVNFTVVDNAEGLFVTELRKIGSAQ